MNRYYYPLTNKDIAYLREGKVVTKNFGEPLFPHLMCIVAWNKTKLGKLDKKQFHNMRQAGISVANIPLTNDSINKICNGDGFSVYFLDFEVLVTSHETMLKLGEACVAGDNKP